MSRIAPASLILLGLLLAVLWWRVQPRAGCSTSDLAASLWAVDCYTAVEAASRSGGVWESFWYRAVFGASIDRAVPMNRALLGAVAHHGALGSKGLHDRLTANLLVLLGERGELRRLEDGLERLGRIPIAGVIEDAYLPARRRAHEIRPDAEELVRTWVPTDSAKRLLRARLAERTGEAARAEQEIGSVVGRGRSLFARAGKVRLVAGIAAVACGVSLLVSCRRRAWPLASAPPLWGLGAGLAAFAAASIAILAGGLAAGAISSMHQIDPGVVVDGVMLLVVFAILGLLLRSRGGSARALIGAEGTIRWEALGVGVVAFASYAALTGIVAMLVPGSVSPCLRLEEAVAWAGERGYLALLLLQLGILAPVAEEIVFRGMLFRTLVTNLRLGLVFSALISAAFFCVSHVGFGAADLGEAFLLGLIASFAYAASGSLVTPILLHSIANASRLIEAFARLGA